MITERDERAIAFIKLFRIVTTNMINEEIYKSDRVCRRRLAELTKQGVLQRQKNLYTKEHIYSARKINTKQLKHHLLRATFYLQLKKMATIDRILVEPELGTIQPDALIVCKYQGKSYFFTLEVETSNNTIDITKYNRFGAGEYQQYFKVMPFVVYITDKHIDQAKVSFKYVRINLTLDNLIDLFGPT